MLHPPDLSTRLLSGWGCYCCWDVGLLLLVVLFCWDVGLLLLLVVLLLRVVLGLLLLEKVLLLAQVHYQPLPPPGLLLLLLVGGHNH